MIEFGEQLRRAREEKGMTQQTLAEQLYVTRQSVSRWECGDRFPDLITTKKISQILNISLDDLLSDNEMKNVVERNPVIENKTLNAAVIVLYAFLLFPLLVIIPDRIIQYFLSVNQFSTVVNIGTLLIIFSSGILAAVFGYGLYNSLRGQLSPKKTGLIIIVSFAFLSIETANNFYTPLYLTDFKKSLLLKLLWVLPETAVIASACLYFIKGKNNPVLPLTISAASLLNMCCSVLGYFGMIRAEELYNNAGFTPLYFSTENTLQTAAEISLNILIIYQTLTLYKKRKQVIQIKTA